MRDLGRKRGEEIAGEIHWMRIEISKICRMSRSRTPQTLTELVSTSQMGSRMMDLTQPPAESPKKKAKTVKTVAETISS